MSEIHSETLPKRLYHRTKSENIGSIKKNGLLKGGDGNGAFVCLSEKPDSWWRDEELIEVETDELELRMFRKWPDLDEIDYWGNIPPTALAHIEK